jgi:hypothetical protein
MCRTPRIANTDEESVKAVACLGAALSLRSAANGRAPRRQEGRATELPVHLEPRIMMNIKRPLSNYVKYISVGRTLTQYLAQFDNQSLGVSLKGDLSVIMKNHLKTENVFEGTHCVGRVRHIPLTVSERRDVRTQTLSRNACIACNRSVP